MYLGNTTEEKRDSVNELFRRGKRVGKIFGILGIFLALVYFYVAFAADGSFFARLIMIFSGIVVPFAEYFVGFIWYLGCIAIKSWFIKRNISASDMAATAGSTLAVSYILGGRKAAKTSAFIMLLIVLLTGCIGMWVGLYQYLTLRKFVKVQPA